MTAAECSCTSPVLAAPCGSSQFHGSSRVPNLAVWLFTNLRNSFYTEHRKSKREVGDSAGLYVGRRCCQVGEDSTLWQDVGHERDIQSVPGLQLSSRNHQPGGLIVSLLQLERT